MVRRPGKIFLASVLGLTSQLIAQATIEVRGRVVDLRGAPIAGVEVTQLDWREPDRVLTTARTDTDGRYSLTARRDEGASQVRLSFLADGHARLQLLSSIPAPETAADATTVSTIALPGAVAIAGRIRTAAGAPIPGAVITTRDLAPSDSHVQLADRGTSNEQGIFQLRAVPASLLELRVEAAGHLPVRLLAIDRTSPLDIRLETAAFTRGRVVSKSGGPVACVVALANEDGSSERCETDADGAFRLPIRPGLRYRLRAYGKDLQKSAYSPLLRDGHDDLVITAGDQPLGEILRFAVVDAAARPVEAFTVEVQPRASHTEAATTLWFGFYTETGAHGALETPLPARRQEGEGLALVRASGFAQQVVPLPTPSASTVDEAAAGPLRITLRPESVLTGCVRDSAGQPVAGALVWHLPRRTRVSGYSSPPRTAVRTDAAGNYRLGGLAPGDYGVQVAHPRHPIPVPSVVAVPGGRTAPTLDFTLDPARPMELSWRNAPATEGWHLTVVPERSDDRPRRGDRLPSYSGGGSDGLHGIVAFDTPFRSDRVTGAAARVALERLTLGRVTYRLSHDLGRIDLAAGASHELDLAGLRTGRVVGRVQISGVVDCERLIVSTAEGGYGGPRALVASDGSFELELAPGAHKLQIEDLLSHFVLAHSDAVLVEDGKESPCTVDVTAGALDIQVVLPDGATRTAMATLVARAVGQPDGRPTTHVLLNDLRGNIRLLLPPGEVELGFQRPRGVLSAEGVSFMVPTTWTKVVVVEGKTVPVRLAQPELETDETLASERHQ